MNLSSFSRAGLLERMPAMKENTDSPEVFGAITNGEVTPAPEPVKGKCLVYLQIISLASRGEQR